MKKTKIKQSKFETATRSIFCETSKVLSHGLSIQIFNWKPQHVPLHIIRQFHAQFADADHDFFKEILRSTVDFFTVKFYKIEQNSIDKKDGPHRKLLR